MTSVSYQQSEAVQALVERGIALGAGPTVLIGDSWEDGDTETVLTSVNPATGQVLAQARAASAQQAARAARRARVALDAGWGTTRPEERSRLLHRLADELDAHRSELEALIITELGSPVSTARTMQVASATARLRYFADLAITGPAGGWERHMPIGDGRYRSAGVLFWQPAGVVAAITAYNFPLGIATLKVGAALAAGCTVVLSPSPRTFLATTALVRLAERAGLPPGVLNLVTGETESSAELTLSPDVDVVTFTGSSAVGAKIQAQASSTIKRVVLELGGKSPSVLLPGAPLETAIRSSVLRFSRNAGQACGATTRILVPRSEYDAAAALCGQVIAGLPVGDPWDEQTLVGPLIRGDHRDSVEAAIRRAVENGAEIVAGGGRPPIEDGYYLNPAVLGSVSNQDEVARHELFGPIAILIPYTDADEALRIANDTEYGLNAGVWGPLPEAISFARRIRSGTVAVNGGGPSRPDAPWGGFGRSGIGRDGGEEGLREFLEVQHVHWPLG
jgi:aldehyde dehydrogenase (NAD+)